MYIHRRDFLKLGLLGAGAIFLGRHNIAPANVRPNIMLILANNFGWGDASCNNPEVVIELKTMLQKLIWDGRSQP